MEKGYVNVIVGVNDGARTVINEGWPGMNGSNAVTTFQMLLFLAAMTAAMSRVLSGKACV